MARAATAVATALLLLLLRRRRRRQRCLHCQALTRCARARLPWALCQKSVRCEPHTCRTHQACCASTCLDKNFLLVRVLSGLLPQQFKPPPFHPPCGL
eukprot:235489-Chlamydomonas_euryale.AAC.1